MKQFTTITIFMMTLSFGSSVFAQEKNNLHKKNFAETKAVNDASLQGHIQNNVEKICSAYASDAVILPPGINNPIIGLDAIKTYYVNSLKSGQSLKISTENIKYEAIDENHANEVGRYIIYYQAKGEAFVQEIKGHMLIVWEKDSSGAWKIKLDMWH